MTRRFAGYIRQMISIHRKAPCAGRSDASNYRRGFSARAATVCASDIDPLPRISARDWYRDSARQLYLPPTIAQITRDRSKLLCRVYGYLTLIPISRPNWISPIASASNVYLASAFWTWGRDWRIGAVHVSTTLPCSARQLHQIFTRCKVRSLRFACYGTRALSCAATRARSQRPHNRFANVSLIFLNRELWPRRVIHLMFTDFYHAFSVALLNIS